MTFTVEATSSAIVDDNWDTLYDVLDDVPGAILIENPDEPTLIIPTDCTEPMKAIAFVSGLATVLGIEIRSAKVYETPEDDSMISPSDEFESPDPDAIVRVREWLTSIPSIKPDSSQKHLTLH